MRGRRVPPTVEAYESLAVNEERVARALIARHNLRMETIGRADLRERFQALAPLAPLALLDGVLIRNGANTTRHPADWAGEWVDHLLWALDSMVAATRLLLCGQLFGAATIVRSQLERWTMHRAFNGQISRNKGESVANYIARAWSTKDGLPSSRFAESPVPPIFEEDDAYLESPDEQLDHEHVVTTDGRTICPGSIYCALSEFLHGRLFKEALVWDSTELLENRVWNTDVASCVDAITKAITLCVRQVRVAAITILGESGDQKGAVGASVILDSFSSADNVSQYDGNDFEFDDHQEAVTYSSVSPASSPLPKSPPLMMLAPLLPQQGLDESVVSQLETASSLFLASLKGRPYGRLFDDAELTTLAFAWHRNRCAQSVLHALELERKLLGDDFDINGLHARTSGWILLTELASLAVRWVENREVACSFGVIASGLRSANWLWIEDDGRSMAILRGVLEHAARVRTLRLKPEKGSILTQRRETRSRDWIEAAGWRRLSALYHALSELAHTTPTSRWRGAIEQLARFQPDVKPEHAILTARRSALDLVSQLAAVEVLQAIKEKSPLLAQSSQIILQEHAPVLPPNYDQLVEATMNHIWGERYGDSGPIEWQKPVAEPSDSPVSASAQLPLTELGIQALRDAGRKGTDHSPPGTSFFRPKPSCQRSDGATAGQPQTS